MSLRIVIETIPHSKQRYETVGDWWYEPDATIHVAVSGLGDWRREAAVALHELVEVLLCRDRGIEQTEVTDFDIAYEAQRPAGDISEAGDDPAAPYVNEHCFATGIERLMVAEFGLNWQEYEKKINSLHK